MCGLESGEGKPKLSGVSIGFSLSGLSVRTYLPSVGLSILSSWVGLRTSLIVWCHPPNLVP
uniref:Uncharacterized protein n=2 Tax=Picea TaxID=3328 RepID=A0A117NI38_PICGL|nr:hypothetical protein ABT39_MTgene3905 [Picea glauca]QHR90359.1 hypothetical protein Q903MT_gene4382 [Picea sitchensis]